MNVEELEDKFSKIFDKYNEDLFKLQDLVLEERNEELTHEYIRLLKSVEGSEKMLIRSTSTIYRKLYGE